MGNPLWAGSLVGRARTMMGLAILAAGDKGLPCFRCSLPVKINHEWDVEHKISIKDGGPIDDPSNWWVSHRFCNRSHGAKLGNALRANDKRRIRKW